MLARRAFPTTLCVLALAGLAASLSIDVATFWGFAPLGDHAHTRAIVIMHLGALLVWFPALFLGRGIAGTFKPEAYIRAVARCVPPIYRRVGILLIAYGAISFVMVLIESQLDAGRYLTASGGVVGNLQAAEYQAGQIDDLRLLASMWILIYGAAALIAMAARNAPNLSDSGPAIEAPSRPSVMN